MGYVAVKGGTKAIEESLRSLKYERLKGKEVASVDCIKKSMRGLIDMVMSEASLYSEDLAALAIKQGEGNVEEAVFLLRAYRSTLPRKHYSTITESNCMFVERRISASFKDILGGQILGAAYDYTHRLIDFDLIDETNEDADKWVNEYKNSLGKEEYDINLRKLPKVLEYLRKDGVLQDYEENNKDPKDVTKKSLEFPTERSERLQILTRGQTGAVNSLGYSALRTAGLDDHPNVGELRVGMLPIYIDSPLMDEGDIEEEYYIGEIKVTEVESFIPYSYKDDTGKDVRKLNIGYGLCYGQNETKAIAMSILDNCLNKKDSKYKVSDEEFVLLSIDSVESSGFISHLKLPHYVTFQSELDSVRKTGKGDK